MRAPLRNARESLTGTAILVGSCALACQADVTQDFTETFLVPDPIDRIEIVVDRGTVTAITYDRPMTQVKRHTFGLPSELPLPPDVTIEDGLYRFEAHCMGSQHCTWDHMLEVPLGTSFDIAMNESFIDLGKTDGDIVADFGLGGFKATRLESANVSVTAERADARLEFVIPPETVTVDLGEGDVTLKVPAGSYRCNFASDAGEVTRSGITCDDAAAAVLDVQVGRGDISVTAATP